MATRVAAGGLFSVAVVAGGKVRSWGDNSFGQLANGSDRTSASVATVSKLSGVTAVAAAGDSVLALRRAGGAGPAAVGRLSTSWRIVGSPVDPVARGGLADVVFSGVSAAGSADAWAVGASNALLNGQPLAGHWNGRAWCRVAVSLRAGRTTEQLHGALEISWSDVWAVGSTTQKSGTESGTLIVQWNGAAWSVVPSPNPVIGVGTSDDILAIAGGPRGRAVRRERPRRAPEATAA